MNKRKKATKPKPLVERFSDAELGEIAKSVAHELADRPGFKNDVAWNLVKRATIALIISVTLIVSIAIGVGGWVKNKADSHIQTMDLAVSNQLLATQTQLSNRITDVDANIRTNIATRLANTNVQATLSEVVTREAVAFFGQNIQPAILAFSNSILSEVSNVASLVTQSQATLRDTTNTLALLQLVGNAMALDIQAYEKLVAFELSTNAILNDIAWRTRRNVELQALLMRIGTKGFDIAPLKAHLDLEHASLARFKEFYAVTAGVLDKCATLTHMVDQYPTRFQKIEVLDFLYDVIKSERNVLVIEHAGGLATQLGAPSLRFEFRKDSVEWYRTNRPIFLTLTNTATQASKGQK